MRKQLKHPSELICDCMEAWNEDIDPQYAALIERAYRRGFFQGASAVVDALESRRTEQSLLPKYITKLVKWRWVKNFKPQCPPRP